MPHWLQPLRATLAAGWLLAGSCAAAAAPELPGDGPLATLQGAYLRAVTPGEAAEFHRELFATVFDRVQRAYATEVDLPALVDVAVKHLDTLPAGSGKPGEVFKVTVNAALRTLDPYSRYVDPQTQSDERTESAGFGGVGLRVEAGEGGVRVVAPMPGTPAERAGLQVGDLILRVDDLPLSGVPLADAIARMRGQPGTSVSITVRRSGQPGEFMVSLTRETIRQQILHAGMEGAVLVLRLGTFTGPVAAAVEKAIDDAVAAHQPRGVVLDLRGNGGGLLREAIKTADLFLAGGDIVSLRGRTASHRRLWQADAAERLAGVPMVVLVDRRSASASELVAAALQENGRALVMGQQSFGKGTVQTTLALGEQKGALKLTTAYYIGPRGQSVQKVGVAPDVELLLPNAPSAERGPGEPQRPPAARARVEPGRCAAVLKAPDPALACAVAYVQAGDLDSFLGLVAGPSASLPATP